MASKKNKKSIFIPKQSSLFQKNELNTDPSIKNNSVFRVKEDRLAVIEASAGTGKTFALVELVLELILEEEIPLKKILLVTFTEKATSELKLRLRSKFQNILQNFDKKNEDFKKVPKVPYWEINSVRKNLLRAALLDFESLQVYTIHGFCKRILNEFAFENRQLFRQEFCETSILFKEVFRIYIRKNILSKKTSISKLFSIYVEQNEGNLESLREEILILLNKEGYFFPNLPPFADFIIFFSKCWKSLVSKDLVLNQKISGTHPMQKIFEQTALNKISSGKTFKNLEMIINILSESHSGRNILDILPNLFEVDLASITSPKLNKFLKSGEKWLNLEEFPELERLWVSELKGIEILMKKNNIFGGAKKIFKVWLIQNIIEEIRFEISKIKLERGFFDFDDLLRIVEEELFCNGKDKSELSPLTKVVRKKYACAIVDEFQDTDRQQWTIFNHLFMNSHKHRLILIGDPKQSIYSFRGADIFTYLKAREIILEKTSGTPFVLKKNFRSSKNLINGLNRIFRGDTWFPKERGITYQEVNCGNLNIELKGNPSFRRPIHLMRLSPKFIISSKKIENHKKLKKSQISENILFKLESLKGVKFFSKEDFLKKLNNVLGEEIVNKNRNSFLNIFLDDRVKNATTRFADAISLEIKKLLNNGESKNLRTLWKDENLERNINENDICILFRKNSEGEILAKSLTKNGINFVFYKQKGLLSGREAIEILILLEAIANPSNFPRIGKLWLTKFFEVNFKEINNVELVNSKIVQQLKEWNLLSEKRKFGKLFDDILNITKLIERELFLRGNERSVTNYLHLFESLNKQVRERNFDLLDLIQFLRDHINGKDNFGENENFLRIESERNAVQLMTMHAAKGLEFPIVFLFGGLSGSKNNLAKIYYNLEEEKQIIDLISSSIPEKYRWQEFSEQKRLLYVAITRARGRLYLPYIDYLSNESKRRIFKINGAYSILNEKLSNIMSKDFSSKNELSFSISTFKIFDEKKGVISKPQRNSILKKWLPAEISEGSSYFKIRNNQEKIFEKIRYEKRGFVVSSFSRIKKREKGKKDQKKIWDIREYPSFEYGNGDELSKFKENDEIVFTTLIGDEESKLGPSSIKNEEEILSNIENLDKELVGGIQMGNFLHKILESLDFSLIRESDSMEEWISRSDFPRYFESLNKNYNFPNSFCYPIAKIIWQALIANIKLGKGNRAPILKLANIERDLREVDFYFPISKVELKSKELLLNNDWNVEKGFLHGSIDYLFEYKNKIYFLDWKSNFLENYHPESLEKEVMQHYELQLQIYTLATCYWFKLNFEEIYEKKFGGGIFLFLRGIEKFSHNLENSLSTQNLGVFFKRPNWKEFLGYEKYLSSINY